MLIFFHFVAHLMMHHILCGCFFFLKKVGYAWSKLSDMCLVFYSFVQTKNVSYT